VLADASSISGCGRSLTAVRWAGDLVDWKKLKTYASWQPIRDLPWPVQDIGDGIFQAGPTAFVVTVPNEQDFSLSNRGPIVTLAIWAESVGAARRAFSGNVDADSVVPGSVPPDDMLLSSGHSTYSAILADACELEPRSALLETASYNSKGRFIHAQIIAQGFEFMFRDPRLPPQMRPYVIRFSADIAARYQTDAPATRRPTSR